MMFIDYDFVLHLFLLRGKQQNRTGHERIEKKKSKKNLTASWPRRTRNVSSDFFEQT